MRKKTLALVVLLVGCQASKPYAGTYVSPGGAEIILRSDGTYRYLIGERTSSRDISGTFQLNGADVTFAGDQNRFKSATIQNDVLKVDSGIEFVKR